MGHAAPRLLLKVVSALPVLKSNSRTDAVNLIRFIKSGEFTDEIYRWLLEYPGRRELYNAVEIWMLNCQIVRSPFTLPASLSCTGRYTEFPAADLHLTSPNGRYHRVQVCHFAGGLTYGPEFAIRQDAVCKVPNRRKR